MDGWVDDGWIDDALIDGWMDRWMRQTSCWNFVPTQSMDLDITCKQYLPIHK